MTMLDEKLGNLKISPKDRKALDDLTVNNIGQLKTIIKYCFETPIQDEFLQNESRLVYFNDICVGGISSKKTGDTIAIKVLAVLPAYRNQGLARMLLNELVENARTKKYDILETKPLYVTVDTGLSDEFFTHYGFELKDDRLIYTL
ncbi:hypothetical protein HDV04_003871 [Boothiomyces sp. JEL0838]|nr:hypothetical protein HDV04_003871 [Boothiomyces sp. JEL0838]